MAEERLSESPLGIETNPNYKPWDISDERRAEYRESARRAASAKRRAVSGEGPSPVHDINEPVLDPLDLMPALPDNELGSLSLFSGGGGLDLGFSRAGFRHVASYDTMENAGRTLRTAYPEWDLFSGSDGDVRTVEWNRYRGKVDVVHGGPPCQPFSIAGRQKGTLDPRDMFPEFVRAVLEIQPKAFVAENVPALRQKKFLPYLQSVVLDPLQCEYTISVQVLRAASFGIPQKRTRVFIVGFRNPVLADGFQAPMPTHHSDDFDDNQKSLFPDGAQLPRCMGVREALGLPDIGKDGLAPTIRSSIGGPRNTTSILSSASALKVWNQLEIWPNGVGKDREAARQFVPENRAFRLSVQDCALIQGFPDSWPFQGPVYSILGQIGNAVPPPLAYRVAVAMGQVLG